MGFFIVQNSIIIRMRIQVASIHTHVKKQRKWMIESGIARFQSKNHSIGVFH